MAGIKRRKDQDIIKNRTFTDHCDSAYDKIGNNGCNIDHSKQNTSSRYSCEVPVPFLENMDNGKSEFTVIYVISLTLAILYKYHDI